MPNTLAHFGVQSVLSHAALHDAEPKWVILGCLIPDLPWIFQRVVAELFPRVPAYELRLYVIVQASLGISLLLCATVALLTSAPFKVFRILAVNTLVHLLLDACQIKWANGVHLFAPFSWELLTLDGFGRKVYPRSC